MTSMTAAERAANHLWAAVSELEDLLLEPDTVPDRYDVLSVKLVADCVHASATYIGSLAEAMDGT